MADVRYILQDSRVTTCDEVHILEMVVRQEVSRKGRRGRSRGLR
jgi:hypothetical protein